MVNILLIITLLCSTAWAAEIPKQQFIDAVIGEAEGEGYRGMLAVSCAIRNRGMLKGVYGGRSKRVREHLYNSHTFVLAVKAYEESRNPDACAMIDGADHWESTDFPRPEWSKNMIVAATIGKHVFYRDPTEQEYETIRDVNRNLGIK